MIKIETKESLINRLLVNELKEVERSIIKLEAIISDEKVSPRLLKSYKYNLDARIKNRELLRSLLK